MTRSIFAELNAVAALGIGGSTGSYMIATAMKQLPYGFPKFLVSTMPPKHLSAFIEGSDIIVIPSIVDITGSNPFLDSVLEKAATLACGGAMISESFGQVQKDERYVALTQFGVTTQAVEMITQRLAKAGYSVLAFHANGAGGRSIEIMISNDNLIGLLDITLSELADDLLGGEMATDGTRLDLAAKRGLPLVIAPGGIDSVCFGSPESVPRKWRNRKFQRASPFLTIMRTIPQDNYRIGRLVGNLLNSCIDHASVLIPLK